MSTTRAAFIAAIALVGLTRTGSAQRVPMAAAPGPAEMATDPEIAQQTPGTRLSSRSSAP